MYPRTNLHTHTRFSDGKHTAEEMVRFALDKGFFSLGFSDHGCTFPDDPSAMQPDTEARYRAEILRLKALYAHRIEIALGYEHDASRPETDLSVYDYCIESVHFFQEGGRRLFVDESPEVQRQAIREFFGGDCYRMCERYYEDLCRAIEHTSAEIVGHLDLITKFNDGGRLFDESHPRYRRAALQALELAAEKDKIVEINTGAIARGYRNDPYPAVFLLEAHRSRGGRIALHSDCHDGAKLDQSFGPAAGLARHCGFTEVWGWKDGALRALPLCPP